MSVGEEKWLLVEWGNKTYGIVESCQLVNVDEKDLSNGCTVVIKGENKDAELAVYLARSFDKSLLEQVLKDVENKMRPDHSKLDTLVKAALAEEPQDYSSSASSWAPSDGDVTESTDTEDEDKKIKIRNNNNLTAEQENNKKERSTKKVLTPSNKVNAIVPHNMKKNLEKQNHNKIKKRKFAQNRAKKYADLELKANCEPKIKNMDINMANVIEMRYLFRDVFRLMRILRNIQDRAGIGQVELIKPARLIVPREVDVAPEPQDEHVVESPEEQDPDMDTTPSDELNRSNDNVFISNKYDTIENITQNSDNKENEDVYDIQNELLNNNNNDGIPIGSGDTIVEKDKYMKIKWTSYTVATRGLLLAVFSRRVLATHSLTGKKSPAFQNKPPKMCLDPKKVSDIILEIRKRFKVKENLIRSIITTKCADECKMLRMRLEKTLTPKRTEKEPKEPNEEDASKTL